MVAPLAVDIDGTLSRPDRSIDSRVMDVLRDWDAPVVVATGKALPYPVALCDFVGVEERVIAENGGVAYVNDDLFYFGDGREAAEHVRDDLAEAGFDLGWGESDLVNRWRETELAVSRERPLDLLRDLAEKHGLSVVDTGFAYHVKSTDPNKGLALQTVAAELEYEPSDFAAVGDSVNDVELFDVVGESYAVANADEHARSAADVVLDESNADGFLAAVDRIRGE